MPDSAESALNAAWFRTHLLDEILPRWLQRTPAPGGLFLPQLDREWRPQTPQQATIVSQSRLVFNFAQGCALTGDAACRVAVEAGAQALATTLRDQEHGGWHWSCGPDGAVLDARKDTYGHAFVLFGLAHAFRATGRQEFLRAAEDAWTVINTRLRDPHGGFVQRTAPDFSAPAEGRSVNPLMHLFEALLAIGAVEERFLGEAERLAAFVVPLAHPQDGLLPERYTSDWVELPADAGGYIDLGHAFEWACLLSAGVEQGLPDSLLAPAGRFLEAGLRLGIDPDDGGARSAASPDGLPRLGGKVWWPQCEAIRALIHFAAVRGRDDLLPAASRMLDFVRAHFLDPEYGGWYGSLHPDGTPAHCGKGSEWKVDYHVVGMCMEAIRRL